MNEEQLSKRCQEIRENLIEVVSKNGGHLAPNLGVVELTVCMNEVFDFSNDIILFDVGHQAYVYKILTGREEKFKTLRKKDGLSPFLDPEESSYDHFISGHAGTALAAGVGFAVANPEKKVVVVVGDASISNGHSLEALNYIGYKKLENMIIILNDNEMSIGQNVGFFSKFIERIILSRTYLSFRGEVRSFINKVKANKVKETLERLEISLKNFLMPLYSLENFGLNFYGSVDGHNIRELLDTLNKIKNLKGPILLLAKTQKGKGYLFAEKDKEKFHGVSSFDIETGNTGNSKMSYSQKFGEVLLEIGKSDENIFALSAGMIKGTGLSSFMENFPERCVDTGIAEGFLLSFAAALAKTGKKPYVCIYSTFIQRAVSQMIHDVSIQNLPVRFIIDRSGIVGEDGKTHNGIYDLSIFLTLENYTVICPTTAKELEQVLQISRNFNSGPLVIRIARENIFDIEDEKDFEIGKWKEIKKGSKNLFIATGTMLKEIVEINDNLKDRGIDGTIVSAASVKPFDEKYLLDSVEKYENIFVLEETYIKNSFGTSILEFLNEKGISKKINKISLKKAIIKHGSRKELLEEEEMSGKTLIERIEEFVYGEKKY